MANDKNDFSLLSKAEWLDLIEKSLKKGSIADFKWELEQGISGLPFAHEDDLGVKSTPFFTGNQDGDWKVGVEWLPDIDQVAGLACDAIKLSPRKYLESDIPQSLHQSVAELTLFIRDEEELELARSIQSGKKQHFEFPAYHRFDPLDLFQLVSKNDHIIIPFPAIPADQTNNSATDIIGQFFANLVDWMEKIEDQNKKIQFARKLRFSYTIASSQLLYELSMLRAIRLVWYNIQKAWLAKVHECHLDATIKVANLSEDKDHQLILATAASISAIVSGVQTLYLDTGNAALQNRHTVRLFRNIQLILKEEASMARVADPVAGSYAIEDLTRKLAGAIWQKI